MSRPRYRRLFYDVHVLAWRNYLIAKRRDLEARQFLEGLGYRTNPDFSKRPLLHASSRIDVWGYIGHRLQVESVYAD